MNSARLTRFVIYVLIAAIALLVLLFQFRSQAPNTQQMTMSNLAVAAQAGEVKSIRVEGDTLHVVFNDGT
jgi:hypothetical protein